VIQRNRKGPSFFIFSAGRFRLHWYWSSDCTNCITFPLKTGFRYAQLPFKTSFIVVSSCLGPLVRAIVCSPLWLQCASSRHLSTLVSNLVELCTYLTFLTTSCGTHSKIRRVCARKIISHLMDALAHVSAVWITSVSLSELVVFVARLGKVRLGLVRLGTVPWLRRLVVGVSPRRPGCNPRPVYVEFVVDKVALGVLLFPPLSIIRLVLLVHYFVNDRRC